MYMLQLEIKQGKQTKANKKASINKFCNGKQNSFHKDSKIKKKEDLKKAEKEVEKTNFIHK